MRVEIQVTVAQQIGTGYLTRWAGNFQMTDAQAQEMQRLKMGLAGRGAVLNSGRRVETSTHVIQYLLEEIARCRTAVSPVAEPVAADGVAVGLPGIEQLA